MLKWNDWIAIAAAATIGLIFGASTVALAGPIQPGGWGGVIAIGAFTATGLIATAGITFIAAERSAAPIRHQVAINSIDALRLMIAAIDKNTIKIETYLNDTRLFKQTIERFERTGKHELKATTHEEDEKYYGTLEALSNERLEHFSYYSPDMIAAWDRASAEAWLGLAEFACLTLWNTGPGIESARAHTEAAIRDFEYIISILHSQKDALHLKISKSHQIVAEI